MSENIKKTAAEGVEQAADAAGNVAPIPFPEAAETPAEGGTGVYTHTFERPFEYEGKTYTELTFNFERLTGRDMVSIDAEMQAKNEYAIAAEISRSFQAKMAAKAAGIGSDVIEAMPIREFNKITNAARSFLLDTGY